MWNDCEVFAGSVDLVNYHLDQLQEEFSKGRPTCVSVEFEDNGDSLTIGLGCSFSILNYIKGDKEPPYFISLGSTEESGTVWFEYFGENSEFLLKNTIPIAVARAAMTEFCDTHKLSGLVNWEEV